MFPYFDCRVSGTRCIPVRSVGDSRTKVAGSGSKKKGGFCRRRLAVVPPHVFTYIPITVRRCFRKVFSGSALVKKSAGFSAEAMCLRMMLPSSTCSWILVNEAYVSLFRSSCLWNTVYSSEITRTILKLHRRGGLRRTFNSVSVPVCTREVNRRDEQIE